MLSHIFPVEAVNDPPSFIPEVARPLLFSILNVALPNSSYPPAFSDEALSSALGYTAQVVTILAAYLGVPLHYPIKSLGSRSAVIDPISMMRGPRAFPLYGKGVDRYRFDYGVFLLNKNIEQVCGGNRKQSRLSPDGAADRFLSFVSLDRTAHVLSGLDRHRFTQYSSQPQIDLANDVL